MPRAIKKGDFVEVKGYNIEILEVYPRPKKGADKQIKIKCNSCNKPFVQRLRGLTKNEIIECEECSPRNQKYKKGDLLGKSKLKMVSDKTHTKPNTVERYAIFECPKCKEDFEMSIGWVLKSKTPISCGCSKNTIQTKVGNYYGINKDYKLIEITNEKTSDGKICVFECPKCKKPFTTTLKNVKNRKHIICSCQDDIKVGNIIGTLGYEVIKPRVKIKQSHTYSIYKCYSCGNHFEARDTFIRNDRIKSCGCLTFTSSYEREIVEFLQEHNIENIETSDRNILSKNRELDIYLPNNKLAIEVNGLYWHSEEQGKDSKYHLNKTNECKDKGIDLLHISSYLWLYKNEIIKDLILKRLGITKTIYARKTVIKELDNNTYKDFLNLNHLQGYSTAKIRLGLFYENELVSIMSFSKSRFSKKDDMELIRFANKLGISVIGGASKLLKYFERNYEYNSLVSYCDNSLFNGSLYDKLGFELSHMSNPNYYYFSRGSDILENRNKYQKHKLKDILENFDEVKSERENMENNNFLRYWDCGNYVYKKIKEINDN